MKETILVIGDQEPVRSALRKRLEMAFPHYQVIETAGPEEAVALVLSQSPRLVIIDMGPPAPKRLEVARRIKALQPSTQIVVWTVYDWETYRADAQAAGVAAYVVKKNSPNELLPVLTALLSAEVPPDSDHRQNNEAERSAITGDTIRRWYL